jgi:hypothetical protein
MKITNIKDLPKDLEFTWGELDDLSEYDIKGLNDIDEIWYYYVSGDYEGSGQLLMRKGNLYDLHDMSHCSCYGPIDDVDFKGMSYDDLIKSLTTDLYKECKILFDSCLVANRKLKLDNLNTN